MITNILPNMISLRDVSTIEDGDRIFFEWGRKINPNNPNYEGNWIREGKFEEIEDVTRWLVGDKLITDVEYLEHHNFMIIKK